MKKLHVWWMPQWLGPTILICREKNKSTYGDVYCDLGWLRVDWR